MQALTKLRERIAPERRTFDLFADVGAPHTVTATIYRYPFRHVVINNFLPPHVYEALSAEMADVLAQGIQSASSRTGFVRFDLYDLYSYVPKPTLDLPLGCFFSESLFQTLERLLLRMFTRETFATFHHHTPNPEDNYIHNDYVYEYLADDPLPNGISPWYYQCDKYKPTPGGLPRVRAATSIFYLNNEWEEGDGGETGIFAMRDSGSLVRKIAPINNRLIAFDITPASYHNYMGCTMGARNSLAQWYFARPEEALARFEGKRPGGWGHLQDALKKGPTAVQDRDALQQESGLVS